MKEVSELCVGGVGWLFGMDAAPVGGPRKRTEMNKKSKN